MIQPQEALGGTCPVLRIQLQQADSASQPSEQHLIPWVPAIVKDILSQSHTIVIAPPSGLLELGRQQMLLHQLEPELKTYGKAAPDSMAARLGQYYMPTKQQLIHHGREDLVKQVVAAGGFIHVAHLLGLRAKRKPAGPSDHAAVTGQTTQRKRPMFIGMHIPPQWFICSVMHLLHTAATHLSLVLC